MEKTNSFRKFITNSNSISQPARGDEKKEPLPIGKSPGTRRLPLGSKELKKQHEKVLIDLLGRGEYGASVTPAPKGMKEAPERKRVAEQIAKSMDATEISYSERPVRWPGIFGLQISFSPKNLECLVEGLLPDFNLACKYILANHHPLQTAGALKLLIAPLVLVAAKKGMTLAELASATGCDYFSKCVRWLYDRNPEAYKELDAEFPRADLGSLLKAKTWGPDKEFANSYESYLHICHEETGHTQAVGDLLRYLRDNKAEVYIDMLERLDNKSSHVLRSVITDDSFRLTELVLQIIRNIEPDWFNRHYEGKSQAQQHALVKPDVDHIIAAASLKALALLIEDMAKATKTGTALDEHAVSLLVKSVQSLRDNCREEFEEWRGRLGKPPDFLQHVIDEDLDKSEKYGTVDEKNSGRQRLERLRARIGFHKMLSFLEQLDEELTPDFAKGLTDKDLVNCPLERKKLNAAMDIPASKNDMIRHAMMRQLLEAEAIFETADVLVIGEHSHPSIPGLKFIYANLEYLKTQQVEVFMESCPQYVPPSPNQRRTAMEALMKDVRGLDIKGIESSRADWLSYYVSETQTEITAAARVQKKELENTVRRLETNMNARIADYNKEAPRIDNLRLPKHPVDLARMGDEFSRVIKDITAEFDACEQAEGGDINGPKRSRAAALLSHAVEIQLQVNTAAGNEQWGTVLKLQGDLNARIAEFNNEFPRIDNLRLKKKDLADLGRIDHEFSRVIDEISKVQRKELDSRGDVNSSFAERVRESWGNNKKKLVVVGAEHAVSYPEQPSMGELIRKAIPGARVRTMVASWMPDFAFDSYTSQEEPIRTSIDKYLQFPVNIFPDPWDKDELLPEVRELEASERRARERLMRSLEKRAEGNCPVQ